MAADAPAAPGPRRAAVLGHPVDHSLSPVLHGAAYAALGLTEWRYDAIDCPEGALAEIVGGAGPDVVGFSVTMPGKPEALALAEATGGVTDRARQVASANTLVRTDDGWRADCTDIDGVTGALAEFTDLPVDPTAVVLGVGGTARPVVAGLAAAGFTGVTLASRRPNADAALAAAGAVGLPATDLRLDDPALPGLIADADLLVSTLPTPGVADHTHLVRDATRLLDALYHPWPTPMGAAADPDTQVVGGDVVLLCQAFGQVEQFTGRPAPREAMAAALAEALAARR